MVIREVHGGCSMRGAEMIAKKGFEAYREAFDCPLEPESSTNDT